MSGPIAHAMRQRGPVLIVLGFQPYVDACTARGSVLSAEAHKEDSLRTSKPEMLRVKNEDTSIRFVRVAESWSYMYVYNVNKS
jgi:hypothetical protein